MKIRFFCSKNEIVIYWNDDNIFPSIFTKKISLIHPKAFTGMSTKYKSRKTVQL